MTDAYIEGYNSFPDKDCLYQEGTPAWNAWWDGYSQAELVSAYYNDDGEDCTYL